VSSKVDFDLGDAIVVRRIEVLKFVKPKHKGLSLSSVVCKELVFKYRDWFQCFNLG